MINIERAKQIDGWMTEAELTWLADWAKFYDSILEIGSWHGRSTRAIADNTKGRVVSVDHFNGSRGERDSGHASAKLDDGDNAFLEFFKNGYDSLMSGHLLSIRGNFSNIASIMIANRTKFDMIFIDGGHTYEEVKGDIASAFLLLKLGGMICGHDYCDAWPGVKKAVDELVPNRAIARGTTIWCAVKCERCGGLFDLGLESVCERCVE